MPDPRMVDLHAVVDKRSALMKAIAANRDGLKLNFCPFGCPDSEIDDFGYCRHLVGFTLDKKTYEPMVMDQNGRRIVQVPTEKRNGKIVPVLSKVEKGDQFVEITSSYRVYRDLPPEESETPDTEAADDKDEPCLLKA
jgi:hypothetical protein